MPIAVWLASFLAGWLAGWLGWMGGPLRWLCYGDVTSQAIYANGAAVEHAAPVGTARALVHGLVAGCCGVGRGW